MISSLINDALKVEFESFVIDVEAGTAVPVAKPAEPLDPAFGLMALLGRHQEQGEETEESEPEGVSPDPESRRSASG